MMPWVLLVMWRKGLGFTSIPGGYQLSKLVNSCDKKVISKHTGVALEFFRIGKKKIYQ